MPTGPCARSALLLLLASTAWTPRAAAFSNVGVGEPVPNAELPVVGGGQHPLLSSRALANVFVFFRPRQAHSLEALKAMADCEQEFAERPVHFVAVVSSSFGADEVRAVAAEAGIRMPVLVDEGDTLYGRIGVRLHPVVGIANERFELVAYEPFRQVNYCDRVRAQIRFALHEIGRADVEAAAAPPRALFPNEMMGAIANRHVRMGESFLRARQYERAAAEARRVLERDPRHASAHLLLGDALAAQGRCAEARTAYDAAREIDPKLGEKRRACAGR